MRNICIGLLLVLIVGPVYSQGSSGGASQPDPFIINDTFLKAAGSAAERKTEGLAKRSQAFNPALKNLVLIGVGQSNCQNALPTLYVPPHSSVIDNFNIYDGGSYEINGPMVGTPTGAPGNVLARLAELFVANSIFDRVIVVPICVGSTVAADWATGSLSDRIGVAMRRLSSRGYTPGATGLTFAISQWQGESDNVATTSTVSYTASMNAILSNAQAAGFSGRYFINLETYYQGTTSANVRTAQSSLPNGTTFFAGGDIDTLNSSNRQVDNIHLNDTGGAAAATLVYNAIHASGAPF